MGPLRADSGKLHQQRGASLSQRRFGDHEENRGRGFNCSLKTEPRGQGNVACAFKWNITQIKDDQAKASALQQQIAGTQCLFERTCRGQVFSLWRKAIDTTEVVTFRFSFPDLFLLCVSVPRW